MCLLFKLTSPLTYLLARRELGSHQAGLVAALGIVLYPPFIYFGATIYSETTALPFFVVFLLAIPGVIGSGHPRPRRGFLPGCFWGFACTSAPCIFSSAPLGPGSPISGARAVPGVVLGRGVGCWLPSRCASLVVRPVDPGRKSHLALRQRRGDAGRRIESRLASNRIRRRFGLRHPQREVHSGRAGQVAQHGRDRALEPRGEGSPLYSQEQTTRRERDGVDPPTSHGRLLPHNAKIHVHVGNLPLLERLDAHAPGQHPDPGIAGNGGGRGRRLPQRARPPSIFWSLPLFVSLVAFISWGSWRFRQPADLGLIVLAASLPFATEVKQFLAGARRRRMYEPARMGFEGEAIMATGVWKTTRQSRLGLSRRAR